MITDPDSAYWYYNLYSYDDINHDNRTFYWVAIGIIAISICTAVCCIPLKKRSPRRTRTNNSLAYTIYYSTFGNGRRTITNIPNAIVVDRDTGDYTNYDNHDDYDNIENIDRVEYAPGQSGENGNVQTV
jgi:hypothetical protein